MYTWHVFSHLSTLISTCIFQGSSPHQRPPVQMTATQRMSTRVSIPTEAAREAPSLPKRVRYTSSNTSNSDGAPGLTPSHPSNTTPAPASTLAVTTEAMEKHTAQLPQNFPHGLSTSSLEPRTKNQLYPLTSLFKEPPLGETKFFNMETPLKMAT